jgi:hypothetical protein
MEINSQLQQTAKPGRMTKQKTLALVRNFKQWIVAGSIVIFGCISALVAFNQGSTATQNTITNTNTNTSDSTQTQDQQPSPSASNGYFDQSGNNYFGQSGSNTWNGGRANGGSHSS